jgi:hypothetical protein
MNRQAHLPNSLSEVCGASIPATSLAALAELRCRPGIRVVVIGQRAWLRWTSADEWVLTQIVAVSGVVLYTEDEVGWSRLGSLLPAGPVPFDQAAQPLAHILTPAGIQPEPPRESEPHRVRIRLVRTDAVQTSTALSCSLTDLVAWCSRVPQPRLERLQAVWAKEQTLVFGARLPDVEGQRFWGAALLLPLGWRTEQELPPRSWREALGLLENEVLLWTDAGAEVIDTQAFEPLTRAGVRLAQAMNDGRGANLRMDSTDAS